MVLGTRLVTLHECPSAVPEGKAEAWLDYDDEDEDEDDQKPIDDQVSEIMPGRRTIGLGTRIGGNHLIAFHHLGQGPTWKNVGNTTVLFDPAHF